MIDEARQILAGLEFRLPMLLRNVEPLDEPQMRWRPGEGRNSIAWQLWHIAEVEDNWPRTIIYGEPARLPFDVQMRAAEESQFPSKKDLIDYLLEVRAITRQRLGAVPAEDMGRIVHDADFGERSVRDIWAGVVTSFAWHAGQIALTAKLLPDTPVSTQQFNYWKIA